MIKKLFCYIGYVLFRPIWWMERFVPRKKNIWIFGSWYGQKYSDNSKWLYEYVIDNYPNINAIWITKSANILEKLKSENKTAYLRNSFKGCFYCLIAKYAFLTSGVDDVNPLFLNGCKQIWLWHGMPLKKIGFCDDSIVNTLSIKKILINLLNPYNKLSPYCTISSSTFFTPFLEKAFHLQKDRILPTGLPRCDAFFLNNEDVFITQLHKKFPKSKIFLYMPTFRMTSKMDGDVFSPFSEKFGFSEEVFVNFLEKNNIVFLYKPHFVDSSVDVSINSNRFKLLKDNDFSDLYVLLNNIDILVTDYSSVYFDFLVTNKPIYLLTFDYYNYIENSRSHFFDMKKEMHGIFCNTWNDFYESLEIQFDLNKLKIDRLKFASYLDGKSSFKLVEKILEERL